MVQSFLAWTRELASALLPWSPLGILLAFISLGISILFGAWLPTRRGHKQARKLADITNALSTRFVGEFAEDLHAITALVKRAKTRIDVLGDCVDYGSFGAPELQHDYMKAILEAGQCGKKITYLVWGPPAPISLANKFGPGHPEFKQRLQRFLAYFHGAGADRNPHPFEKDLERILQEVATDRSLRERYPILTTINPTHVIKYFRNRRWAGEKIFKGLLLCFHEWVVRRFEIGANADIFIHSAAEGKTELFFWIIDAGSSESEAIFLLPSDRALAFITRDPKLIETFWGIFNTKLDVYRKGKTEEDSQSLRTKWKALMSILWRK